MNINLYAIPPLFCAIITLSVGIIMYIRNKKAELNKDFLGVCIAVFTWLSFYAINFGLSSENPAAGEIFLRVGYCGVSFISLTFFQFIATFVQLPARKVIKIANLAYGLILIILIIKTDLIINGLYKFFWGYYPKAGILHPVFLTIFLLQCSLGDGLLIYTYFKEISGTRRHHQLKYLILGFTIFMFACLDFLGNYGIEFYPFGYLAATLFILIFFYSVIKHNLLDINIVINRGLVYSILITTISIIYLLFVIIIEHLSQNIFRYNSLIVSILSSFVIAVFFVPLKNWIQQLVDKVFFQKTPLELAKENKILLKNIFQNEKMKMVATLASGIAHEVKNPLTAIKTFSEYLPHKLDDKEFLKKFSRIVGGEVNRIDALVNELLEFAKPTPLQLRSTDILKLIRDTSDFLNSRFLQHNITVHSELLSERIDPIMIDPNKIKQVLLNIFLNAIEAMPKGGILKISTLQNDKQTVIKVTDTGFGISKENLKHIFDPFFSTKDSGTGLGLPISHGIITEHGGTIAAESELGKGTTFTLNLPHLKQLD